MVLALPGMLAMITQASAQVGPVSDQSAIPSMIKTKEEAVAGNTLSGGLLSTAAPYRLSGIVIKR